MLLKKTLLSAGIFLLSYNVTYAIDLNIASIDSGHIEVMKKLSADFEQANPDIKLHWHTFNEGSLRMRVISDIAAGGGHYDVMTIGMYETPIWAKRGWLSQLTPSASYQVNDLLPAVRDGLSYENKLYAAPFYGESSMLMYRKDLVSKAGFKIGDRPTWSKIEAIAKAVNDPQNNVYGICLRGKAGWGDSGAIISTIANSFGARWFDMNWNPQLTSAPWIKAVNFYVNLLKKYGPPTPEKNSFPELLSMTKEGKCAMWIDASVAASFLLDKKTSPHADQFAFAQSPYSVTPKGANWLWAWAFAVPNSTKKQEAAQRFINWATSKNYIELVASKYGWGSIPTGTRTSTYQNPHFLEVSGRFASSEMEAINSANPDDSTLEPSPYKGVQFVAIPEFVSIGGVMAQKVSQALQGQVSVESALESSQKFAEREIRRAGY
ncbi:ABC transporter substrate-binding protein [Vibrio nitrifigilis]|uniref:Sugar ABC transporter substrate-binding protein n=1 Tax=Vibrio nitrifigilis TaxID=2789781 RepID=A0ABS0GHY2_9VIBR|nr:sugar ABC transporter substrate-binding protein [Vibrio nitrifigilis]MBF9002049.1 sugar ABC transporter substrate-binding protein [Vibrio nitrifigilis]